MRENNFTVAIMVKDEEKTILKTLRSIRDCDILVIYDTGSSDRTLDMIRKYCKKWDINLRVKEGKFVDFSTSRNVMLKFCEEYDDIGYILLLDSNDIVRNLEPLLEQWDKLEEPLYKVRQVWMDEENQTVDYSNFRLIKNRTGCHYHREIHEVVRNLDYKKPGILVNQETILFQDRKEDNKKSAGRFQRDLEILLRCVQREKNNPDKDVAEFGRDLYFLGQTYACLATLGTNDEKMKKEYNKSAIRYYDMRADIYDNPNIEEQFNCALYSANIFQQLENDWDLCFLKYMKAFEISPTRIEPLMPIVERHIINRQYPIAFMYLNYICKLDMPQVNMIIAKVNWEYYRWKNYAIVCFYLGQTNDDLLRAGKGAIEYAIQNGQKYGIDDNVDKTLLETFEKNIAEIVPLVTGDCIREEIL